MYVFLYFVHFLQNKVVCAAGNTYKLSVASAVVLDAQIIAFGLHIIADNWVVGEIGDFGFGEVACHAIFAHFGLDNVDVWKHMLVMHGFLIVVHVINAMADIE